MTKLRIPHDAFVLVGDGRKALFLRNDGDEKFPNLKVEQVEKVLEAEMKQRESTLDTQLKDAKEKIKAGDNQNAIALLKPVAAETCLFPKKAKDAAKGKALVDFLWWGIHDGEKFARDLQYSPLPGEIVKRTEAKINSITSGGKALRQ